MLHLDLFSGIGGFALAAHWAGMSTVGFSEIDEYCCKILKLHWPGTPNYGDIRSIDGSRFRGVHLLTAGVPCQPASCAGQRRGSADDRWLWPEALRILGQSMPTWAIFENPTGIMSLNNGVEFERVLSQVEGYGYTVQPIGIPACAVDAKHRRNRIWIVAHSNGNRRTTGAILEGEQSPLRNIVEGGSETLADSEKFTEREQTDETNAIARSWDTWQESGDGSNSVPNPNSQQARRPANPRREYCQWEPEPELGRVAPRVPNRVDRLRGLGNAIVPQVAYQIMKLMERV